jgi:FtsP/CotA-like multicopper oxidase with cupredoxin domain
MSDAEETQPPVAATGAPEPWRAPNPEGDGALAALWQSRRTRRSVLRGGAAAAVGLAAAGVAGCRTSPPAEETGALGAQAGTAGAEAGTAAPAGEHMTTAAAPPDGIGWEEMDSLHEAGVKAFPAKTAGLGGQPLAPTLDGNVKVFALECSEIEWEVEPGKMMSAFAYNGQVPGPEIRITEGDRVRVEITNNLSQSTSIHFHGALVPNAMDGVPYITQPPIRPGETFAYEFDARNPGSHMYHSHHNATIQVTKGLLGAFIIEPKDKSQDPPFDREYTLILNDSGQGFTINGKSFPATQPLTAKLGEKVRIRYMNEGLLIHPVHLHGMPQQVFAIFWF